MIMFISLISSIYSLKFSLYYETRWDPLVFDKDVENPDRLDILKSQSGHLPQHYTEEVPNFKMFGDVSIFTLNLYREVIYDTETIETAENIRTILDESHVSVLCLQGVDDTLLKRIHGKLQDQNHYVMTNIDKYDIDMLTGARLYLPIIYDRKLFWVKNKGFFETEGEKKMVYGSYIEIKDLRIPETDPTFTIINIDMFSTFNDVVSAEFANIVSDIGAFTEVNSNPVFIAGTMGTMPPNIHDLIKKVYVNSIEEDKNNKFLPKTTVHAGNQDDNIQRDYVLLKDEGHLFSLNYARILREFLAGEHYPVHAIYSYNENKYNIKSKKEDDKVDLSDEMKAEEKKNKAFIKSQEEKFAKQKKEDK